ncbi:hypothetical protein K1T36_02525 [Pseudomonas protegens]|uniref:hypothetical protein n=1 Tax=Pseudomonas protegens TaxID=380021 RepID=UPI001C69BB07|nr:hypothetical protein [Pseudomonas protegens]QYN02056.1 hypothetical protein K1T36_02525 [Pseudomonas protegens]
MIDLFAHGQQHQAAIRASLPRALYCAGRIRDVPVYRVEQWLLEPADAVSEISYA